MSDRKKQKLNNDDLAQVKSLIGDAQGEQFSLDDILAEFGSGKLPGRGAYVCPDPACLARARKTKALERAFSAPLPPEVWEALEAQMKEVPRDVP